MSKNDEKSDFAEKFSELEEIVSWFDGDVQDIDET